MRKDATLIVKTRQVQAQIGRQTRDAVFQSTSIDREKRTIDVVFTTGHMGRRRGWLEDWNEGLEVSERAIRLDRLNGGAPVLDVHRAYDQKNVIGVVERAWVQGGKGHATLRFDTSQEADAIWGKVERGIMRNVSVGYEVHKLDETTEKGDKIRSFIATDWEPVEISVVPIGFDPGAQVRSSDSVSAVAPTTVTTRALPGNNQRSQSPMDEEQLKALEAAAEKARADVAAAEKRAAEAAATAVKAERERMSEITRLCRSHKVEDMTDDLIRGDKSLDQCREAVLAKLEARSGAAPIASHSPRIEAGQQDEVKTRRDAAVNAILHRFEPTKTELTEPARQFRGMSLVRMAEELLGRDVRGMTRNEIAQRALSSSDFPYILATVAGKTLRDGYQLRPQSFRPFVRFGTLPDYKVMQRTSFGDAPNLAVIAEDGEYTEGTVGEGKEVISLAKYGKAIKLTEKLIINDDMDAITRLPSMMGAAAARLESVLVYAVLLNNATMNDTVALFHATHGNLGSASAINEAGLTAAKKAMRDQTTLDGNDYLDLEPAYLIVGTAKEVEARKILSAQLLASASSSVNVFANSMQLIVEPRVTGNKWFVTASPQQIDTIEVAYLEGMSGPEISSKEDFDSDGIKLKVKHVVGVKAIDHRGLFYNPGA